MDEARSIWNVLSDPTGRMAMGQNTQQPLAMRGSPCITGSPKSDRTAPFRGLLRLYCQSLPHGATPWTGDPAGNATARCRCSAGGTSGAPAFCWRAPAGLGSAAARSRRQRGAGHRGGDGPGGAAGKARGFQARGELVGGIIVGWITGCIVADSCGPLSFSAAIQAALVRRSMTSALLNR